LTEGHQSLNFGGVVIGQSFCLLKKKEKPMGVKNGQPRKGSLMREKGGRKRGVSRLPRKWWLVQRSEAKFSMPGNKSFVGGGFWGGEGEKKRLKKGRVHKRALAEGRGRSLLETSPQKMRFRGKKKKVFAPRAGFQKEKKTGGRLVGGGGSELGTNSFRKRRA